MNHHLQPWRVIQQISELASLPCGDNNLCILEHLAALRRCMELRVGLYGAQIDSLGVANFALGH